MKKRYFGTDGIREKANTGSLTPSNILDLSQAFGEVFKKRGGKSRARAAVGADTRISCDMIRCALIAGLTSIGCDVVDFGVLPTPALAYLTKARGFDMGFMISASHNPVSDNGIKVFGSDGFKLPDEVELEVESRVDDRGWKPALPTGIELGRIHSDETGLGEYRTHILAFFKAISLNGLKVAVDCANGAAWKTAPEIFTSLGAKVVAMANDPDGTNINMDCGSVCPQRLAGLVVSEKCDVGIALDGDGDRVVFVDSTGRVLNGDHVLAFLACSMKENGILNRSTVAASIMSNIGLELALEKEGISLVRTDVGDRHITALLRKDNLSLGGEQSGHIVFGEENNYTGDGLFTALKVLCAMMESGCGTECLASSMCDYPQVLINVDVSSKPPLMKLKAVEESVSDAEKALGNEGRVILRYSGTEKMARVMVEGKDQDKVNKLAESIAAAVRNEIG